jgi:hypothetical protein
MMTQPLCIFSFEIIVVGVAVVLVVSSSSQISYLVVRVNNGKGY